MIDLWNSAADKVSQIEPRVIEKVEHMTKKLDSLNLLLMSCVKQDEFKHVKELAESHESKINTHSFDIKQIQDELLRIDRRFASCVSLDDISIVKLRIESLENRFNEFQKRFILLESKVSGYAPAQVSSVDVNDKFIKELVALRQEFEQHKLEVFKNLHVLNVTLPTKADKIDLEDLETRLCDKLNDVLRTIIERMPNKDEINKKFALINKKINQLFEMLNMQGGNLARHNEDDAMFTKKPFGPVTCASCEKNIFNL